MLFPQVLQQSDHITIPHVHRSSQAVPRRNSRSRNDGKRPFGHFMITVFAATPVHKAYRPFLAKTAVREMTVNARSVIS